MDNPKKHIKKMLVFLNFHNFKKYMENYNNFDQLTLKVNKRIEIITK